MSERAWQRIVMDLAAACGYLGYHTFDSRRSQPGFPDCVFVRRRPPGRVLFVELKSDTGRLTAAQAAWLEALRAAGQEAYVWRPSQLADVQQVLSREGRP